MRCARVGSSSASLTARAVWIAASQFFADSFAFASTAESFELSLPVPAACARATFTFAASYGHPSSCAHVRVLVLPASASAVHVRSSHGSSHTVRSQLSCNSPCTVAAAAQHVESAGQPRASSRYSGQRWPSTSSSRRRCGRKALGWLAKAAAVDGPHGAPCACAHSTIDMSARAAAASHVAPHGHVPSTRRPAEGVVGARVRERGSVRTQPLAGAAHGQRPLQPLERSDGGGDARFELQPRGRASAYRVAERVATERSGEAVILVDLLGDEFNWQCQEECLKTLTSPFCWRCRPTLQACPSSPSSEQRLVAKVGRSHAQ
eukprot:scaffold25591_cov72-Phaeocystis_antarctica.AAC.3